MAEARLKSEGVVISAPTSYSGSARRLWKLTTTPRASWARILVAIGVAVLILLAWVLVTAWYMVTVFLFGILLIPWRLIRRGSRREKAARLRHRELLDRTPDQGVPSPGPGSGTFES